MPKLFQSANRLYNMQKEKVGNLSFLKLFYIIAVSGIYSGSQPKKMLLTHLKHFQSYGPDLSAPSKKKKNKERMVGDLLPRIS